MKNIFKERIKLYTSFIKENKIAPISIPRYMKKIEEAKEILRLLKEDKMTLSKFNKLDDDNKWDIYLSHILKNVTWYCKSCGIDQDKPRRVIDGQLICNNCGNELTHRTGGGQHDPFYWDFEEKI